MKKTDNTMNTLECLISELVAELLSHELKVATVESCTGGGLSAQLTELAGSSIWFDRGFVTYSNQSKQEMVGVSAVSLNEAGAVSEVVARQMAEGGVQYSDAQLAIAITGVAGPGGGTDEKPVGMVCFGSAREGQETQVATQYFAGNRQQIRHQSLIFAVSMIVNSLRG